ncbi:MAG: hypothetical protein JWN11_2493 [Hyphomicrobiales bacterium]|nr:hypothetical protein [Hyphomicrobiales bacterium]
MRRSWALWVLLGACAVAMPAHAQNPGQPAGQNPGQPPGMAITPAFAIWDVKLGQPITQIPDTDVVNTACGTNGGPPSIPLKSFSEYAKCPPEPSGLREIYFQYDDEQDYIAKALDLEYRVLQGGTSIYAHPVMVSVLVDDKGIARGIRIVTDDRASGVDRRSGVTLATNLRNRYDTWNLSCQKVPPRTGESGLGQQFIHDLCTADNPSLGQRVRIEGTYLRKKGQTPINVETQTVTKNNFESKTRFELVQLPYQPAAPTGD